MRGAILQKFGLMPLASVLAGSLILFSGCASPDESSYNSEYRENLATDPKYYIKDETDTHFRIVVHQGSPSTLGDRVSDSKQAATDVAKSECLRLGWGKWHLDYVQERDQGWMHIVVAEVTREVYQPTSP